MNDGEVLTPYKFEFKHSATRIRFLFSMFRFVLGCHTQFFTLLYGAAIRCTPNLSNIFRTKV